MESVDTIRKEIERVGFAIVGKTDGRSMRPLLWGGNHYVVVTALDGPPCLNDILLFRGTDARGREVNIVHRLIEIRHSAEGQPLYITRGDNCLGCERVSLSEIIGSVEEIHRRSGFRPWYVIPDKKFNVRNRRYLAYSRIWNAIWPLRRIYYILRNRLNLNKR